MVGTSACGAGGQVGLAGRFTLADALQRLLAGAPCTWRVVDPRTVRIAPFTAAPTREVARSPSLVAELMVTATKRPTSLGRIAAGVSAISHDQLEVTSATDIGRTTGQLAGVTMTNLGPARDKLMIRGLSDGAFTGRTRSTVGTYLDDAPINFNAPDPDLRLADVERIEVMRGPQGALYGSGSISGVYRIVTRKPDLDRAAFGALAIHAWTDGGSPSNELEAYGNAVLVPDRVAARAVAYYDVQGGYLDNVSLHLSNVDRTERDGGRLALRAQLGEAWQLDLSGAGQRLRSNDSQYTTQGMGQQRRSRIRETHKNDFAEGAITLKGELGWASLQSSTAWVQHTFSSQYDASVVASEVFQVPDADLGLFHETSRVSMAVQDLILRSSGDGALGWLVGAYAADTNEKAPSTLGIANTPGRLDTAYRENRHDRLREFALYGEASWRFADGWTAAAGGRLFESRIRTIADIVSQSAGGTRDFDRARRFDGVSPMISLQHEFADGGLVYALYSEGFRPGGFNSGGFLPIRPNRATFAADRLQNVELGLKMRLLDRRLGIRSALYYDEWSNIQTDQYRPSGLAFTGNVGDARILGLETEMGYDFAGGLSLQANALLADPKVTRTNPDFTTFSVIGGLPGVPKVSGGLLALYERPAFGLTLRLTGEASYVGHSYAAFDAPNAPRMGGYLRARLSAELASSHWSAGVFVANPSNESGDTFAYGNPFTFRPDTDALRVRQVTPQRPRTIGVRLAAAF